MKFEDHDGEGLLDHEDHEDQRLDHEDRQGHHTFVSILQELLFQLLHEDHEDRKLGHVDHDEVVGLLLHEGRGGQLGHHTFVLILRELLLEMLLVAGLSLLEDHG